MVSVGSRPARNPPGSTQLGPPRSTAQPRNCSTPSAIRSRITGLANADQAQAAGYQNEVGAYDNAESAYGDVANAYATAATIANQNVTLENSAGKLQQYQEGLQAKQTIGAQRAGVAAAGFGNSGSALYLLASSNRQAALTQALTGIQTNITATGYKQQAAADVGQQAAATAQGAAVGAQAAAAQGAANAANAAATAASNSAGFNQVQAGNYAAQLAQLEAPLQPSSVGGASSIAQLQTENTPSPAISGAVSAFQQAGVSTPSALQNITPTLVG